MVSLTFTVLIFSFNLFYLLVLLVLLPYAFQTVWLESFLSANYVTVLELFKNYFRLKM